ncbi:hypothetical protein BDV39DRAFT_67943 [Aspergillus sergii]|uniref:Uncharacterized protein n=1 Tax=Aspergillus sergii TaxID=1034303 RepID=A0A5N6X5M3_9EURO|nr:hypothetical protein BDV39DRAFT_67943 [Aspergillus sergii]
MDRGAFRVLVLKRNESRLTAPWSRTRATASYEADGNWGQTHRSGGQNVTNDSDGVSSPLPITRTCDSLPELPLFPRPSLVLGAAADSVDPFCSASHTTSYYYLLVLVYLVCVRICLDRTGTFSGTTLRSPPFLRDLPHRQQCYDISLMDGYLTATYIVGIPGGSQGNYYVRESSNTLKPTNGNLVGIKQGCDMRIRGESKVFKGPESKNGQNWGSK